MIIRIVRMSFRENEIDTFKKVFNESKSTIEGFEGCMKVDLLRDVADPTVFTTYSHWESEDKLNAYRNSSFFKTVWSKTKVLFSDAPQAHSYSQV